jgi:hypothetical protein
VVTAIGVGLEWHVGHLRGVVDAGSTLPSGTAQPDLPSVEAWGESNLDQPPANPAHRTEKWSSTLPGPRRSAQLIRATRCPSYLNLTGSLRTNARVTFNTRHTPRISSPGLWTGTAVAMPALRLFSA